MLYLNNTMYYNSKLFQIKQIIFMVDLENMTLSKDPYLLKCAYVQSICKNYNSTLEQINFESLSSQKKLRYSLTSSIPKTKPEETH